MIILALWLNSLLSLGANDRLETPRPAHVRLRPRVQDQKMVSRPQWSRNL